MFLMEFNEIKLSDMSNIWQEENKDDVDKKIFYFQNMTIKWPLLAQLALYPFSASFCQSLKMFSNIQVTPRLHHLPGIKQWVKLISQFTKGSIKTELCWTRFLIFFICLIEKAFNHWVINNEIKDNMNNKWKPWEADNVGL